LILPLLDAASQFDPVAEFTDFVSNPYVDLPLGLDINKAVIYIWLAGLLAILLPLIVIRRGLRARPGAAQTTAEAVYDLAENQIARAGLPEEGMRLWFPYVASLFFFIWMMNLIGFIPLPFGDHKVDLWGLEVPQFQIYAATANLSVTLALTLVTFFIQHIEGIRYNGVIGYFKSWMPSGLPKFFPLVVLIAIIEVISQLVRVVSLSFRLFFNLLAGHLVIAVFLAIAALLGGGQAVFWPVQLLIGLPLGVAIFALEATLIAGLQAFIFATLSAIYIGGAIHPDH
jgi:F-type H+-transporting ATPase subunit a